MKRKTDSLRWAYLILGVLALLVAGVVYAWSILKAPLRRPSAGPVRNWR